MTQVVSAGHWSELAQVSQLGQWVAGVDEVGRGPLAGPVVAAAAILKPNFCLPGVNDSKKLSAKRRVEYAAQIREQALDYCIGMASVAEVDRLNILQASLLAMTRSIQGLRQTPSCVMVDGNRLPRLKQPALALVKGDSRIVAISAASILAKVARDDIMVALSARFPEYGFERHMGYGTAQHLRALDRFGACAAHRLSFAPVRAVAGVYHDPKVGAVVKAEVGTKVRTKVGTKVRTKSKRVIGP